MIRLRDAFAALFKRLLKQIPLQQLPGGNEPRIQVNGSHHGFERIREQRLLLASAGFFFAASEPEMLSKPQSPGRRFQGTCVHNTGPALGKLSLGPSGKCREEVFAREQLEDGVAQEFQAFVIRQMRQIPRRICTCSAQLRWRRAVGQCSIKKLRIRELVAQALL